MKDEHEPNPPFDGSWDEYPELLDGWFQSECKEVWRRQQSLADGSLKTKAENLLRYGATRVLEGHPHPDFVRFVAACILSRLTGAEPTMDHAFRLKKKRSGKETSGEKQGSVILAFSSAMAKHAELPHKVRMKKALQAAFKEHHGWSPADHEHVEERMKRTRKILRENGNL